MNTKTYLIIAALLAYAAGVVVAQTETTDTEKEQPVSLGSPEKNEVWQVVQSFNDTWADEGDFEALAGFFHENIVVLSPGVPERIVGRDSCLTVWKGFAESTVIRHYHEDDPLVELYNDGRCAIVTYYFEMAFESEGKLITAAGRDMFTLVKDDGRWLVVADQFSPYPRQ